MKRILHYLIFITFLTSSFDIFFNLNLGGFNVRTCYMASLLFAFIYFLSYSDASKFKFIGFVPFFIWLLFPISFVAHTQFLNRNIGYILWMIFNIMVCYSIYKFSRVVDYQVLIRYYLLSFFIIALVGITQFLLSTVGIHVFITMWWRMNVLPRVNGLSYEPSYFATYLLIGFVFMFYAWKKKIYFFTQRFQLIIMIAIALAILLSTSRMGILFMVSILVFDFISMLARSLVSLKISRVNLIVSASMILFVVAIVVNILADSKLRHRYLTGTGLESTSSHSRDTRISQMTNVWKIFVVSPVYGYSFGGIASGIATYYGVNPKDQKKAKEFEGLNIFLEVLAASGIFGFMFFAYWMIFFFRSIGKLPGLLRMNGLKKEADILICLRYALIAELLILIFSQNILRPYLWILIGVTSAMYFRFKEMIFNPEANSNHINS